MRYTYDYNERTYDSYDDAREAAIKAIDPAKAGQIEQIITMATGVPGQRGRVSVGSYDVGYHNGQILVTIGD